MNRDAKPTRIETADPEAIRMRRLRADARRSMTENLAQGIALSHALHRFAGVARR